MPNHRHHDPQDSRRALADAFEGVIKADQERRAAARRSPVRRTPWLGLLSVVALAATVVWLAVERPPFLFPPAAVESPGRDDAGLRLTMYAAAKRLEAHRAGTGRYPMRLSDVAGVSDRDLRYERMNDTTYVLRGRRGAATLALGSRDDLEAFLGTTLAQALQRSGR